MENRQLFVISIAWSDYQLQEKEKRSNQYLGAVLVCFDLIWLCCRAVRSLLEAGDQFVQRAAGLHMDHVVSSLVLKITCLLGIVMLVPEVERISTQIWNTQFVKIPVACSEQSGFRAPNLETNPETCFLQQCHFHPFPTFKSSKSSGRMTAGSQPTSTPDPTRPYPVGTSTGIPPKYL